MALGKVVAYTPFNETSFGYGSTELATNYSTEFPNSDDIVKITIQHASGNWDSTGHLSTPSSGTAVAVYNEAQELWYVKGERDDVDAVLAELSFYPADKPATRNWTPTEWKLNSASGVYTGEEPPTIGDTTFTIRAYNASDVQQTSETVDFSVTEAVFGNQRPYWSTLPANGQDLNGSSFDAVAGGTMDLGTISHGSDTENVRVTCEFLNYYNNSQYTGGDYGSFTLDSQIYIGDKKPSPSDNEQSRFDFTGSVAEAQAFLDNVRYYNAGNSKTFKMRFRITDGVVGSYLDRTVWFSDAVIGLDTIPDQHFVEDDDPAYWDFGNLNFDYSDMPEVDSFTVTVTLDATGRGGTSNIVSGASFDTQSYTSGTGVWTGTTSSINVLKAGLRQLQYTPNADFDDNFTMTVDFTFSNSTIGSSYTATQQSVDVTVSAEEEVQGLTSTHSYVEDQRYDFVTYPQIIHGRNDSFDVIFTLSDTDAGRIKSYDSSAFALEFGVNKDKWKITGTRDQVNDALSKLYFIPSPDYDENFTITFTVDRISGGGTPVTSNGTFTMNAIALADFSFPLTNPVINWEVNKSSRFNTELEITDTAVDSEDSPVFGSTYTVIARLRQGNSAFTNGVLHTKHADLLESVSGDYTNEITLTGSKSAINFVLTDLSFIPNPAYPEFEPQWGPAIGGSWNSTPQDVYVDFKVNRDFDGAVLDGLDFSESVRVDLVDPILTLPFEAPQLGFKFVEDEFLDLDSKYRIKETITENPDYIAANGFTEYYGTKYKVTITQQHWDGSGAVPYKGHTISTTKLTGSATQSGKGWDTVYDENWEVVEEGDPLIITGTKAEVNTALANIRFTPTELDLRGSQYFSIWVPATLERVVDEHALQENQKNICSVRTAQDADEYLETWENVEYFEDEFSRKIFSHIDEFILDGAADIFDGVTYEVTVRLANETTGKWLPYVEEDYIEDTELSVFVNDFEVRIEGTKAVINEAIADLDFKPFADVSANVNIHYTQKRTYNGTTTTQANDVVVTTMQGNARPNYSMGSSVGNMQFFVEDRYRTGLDLTGDAALSRTTNNKEVYPAILTQADPLVTLTPRQITENIGYTYDAPITVLDTYEDVEGPSLYKVEFDGGSLLAPKNESLTTLGASLNITDTGWMSRDELNRVLKDGIFVTGVSEENGNVPAHGAKYEVTFTVKRKTATGTITTLAGPSNTLTYFFASGFSVYAGNNRIDNIESVQGDLDDFVWKEYYEPIAFKQTNGDERVWGGGRTLELYGRIRDVAGNEWSDIHSIYDYHENLDSGPIDYIVKQRTSIDTSSDISLVGNYLDFQAQPTSNMNTRFQVQLYFWSKYGTYIKVGSASTGSGNWRLWIEN